MNKAIILMITAILLIPVVLAIPTFHQFYGYIYENSSIINEAVWIVAYINNASRGGASSLNGAYGYEELFFVENGNDGDIIEFYVNGYPSLNYTFINEEATRLNLTLNESKGQVLCGNGKIDLGEECDLTNITDTCQSLGYDLGGLSCNADCSLDRSGCSYGGGSDGGSGGGSRGGGGSGVIVCTESWSCTAWEPRICPASRRQTRNCTDVNNCGTFVNKPSESRICYYYQAKEEPEPEEEIAEEIIKTQPITPGLPSPRPPPNMMEKLSDSLKKNKTTSIIVSILAASLLFFGAHKGVKSRMKKKRRIKEIEAYIHHHLNYGYAKEHILMAVQKAGWEKKLIEDIIAKHHLVAYVRNCLKLRYPHDVIVNYCKRVGWKKKIVGGIIKEERKRLI